MAKYRTQVTMKRVERAIIGENKDAKPPKHAVISAPVPQHFESISPSADAFASKPYLFLKLIGAFCHKEPNRYRDIFRAIILFRYK